MASFDRSEMERSSDAVHKYPIRRLEPSIQKFIKVLEIDLDRLHKHGMNMKKLISIEDWPGLNKEQINASRTIQQIKANINEIEKARKQTVDEDLKYFDEKVEDMKQKALKLVQEFITGEPEIQSSLQISKHDFSTDKEVQPLMGRCLLLSNEATDQTASLPSSTDQIHVQQELHVVPENSEAAASWEALQENLQDLNELVKTFAQMVNTQGEQIDHIESNIDQALTSVQKGNKNLSTAAKLKAVAFPLTGALIGGIAGGPVGLIAGAKIGLVAAGVGGVVGFASGKLLKNHQDKAVELEMRKLNVHRSTSLPEISKTEKQGTEN